MNAIIGQSTASKLTKHRQRAWDQLNDLFADLENGVVTIDPGIRKWIEVTIDFLYPPPRTKQTQKIRNMWKKELLKF